MIETQKSQDKEGKPILRSYEKVLIQTLTEKRPVSKNKYNCKPLPSYLLWLKIVSLCAQFFLPEITSVELGKLNNIQFAFTKEQLIWDITKIESEFVLQFYKTSAKQHPQFLKQHPNQS